MKESYESEPKVEVSVGHELSPEDLTKISALESEDFDVNQQDREGYPYGDTEFVVVARNLEGEIVGFIHGDRTDNNTCIFDIPFMVLHPKYRTSSASVIKEMMRLFVAETKARGGKKIVASVSASHARLYQKLFGAKVDHDLVEIDIDRIDL